MNPFSKTLFKTSFRDGIKLWVCERERKRYFIHRDKRKRRERDWEREIEKERDVERERKRERERFRDKDIQKGEQKLMILSQSL